MDCGTLAAVRHAFQPELHERELLSIIREIDEHAEWDTSRLNPILRKYPRDGKGLFSRSQLIAGFRHFARRKEFRLGEDAFLRRVRMRPVRSQSGVTPVTVLTKPFPCPGRCIFCPSDLRMPKSYLADEPGAQRAAANRFDPYLQSWNRLAAYHAIGHPTDKIELIVLGGTWSFYPKGYQIWFVKRCFEALTDFGAGRDRRPEVDAQNIPSYEKLPAGPEGGGGPERYNREVSSFLRRELDGRLVAEHEQAHWPELERAQRENESARCRSVGLVLETRPDHVSEAEVVWMRRLGCTKVQIGIQSLSDDVLAANQRGHDVATTRRAVGLLRRAGFKIHAHWMPNLHGSSPAADIEDFGRVFDDPQLRPDELKIYPCSLIDSAELMDFYRRGEWRPYRHEELLFVLCEALERVPRYCRVTRVIRDISSHDIVVGNKLTNFREIAERSLRKRGGRCRDIRSRELRARDFEPEKLTLGVTEYETGSGGECFLEFVTPEDCIVAFLRLSLPNTPSFVGEIASSALVREVHVYGAALGIGAKADREAQHRGLGRRLLEEAARRAREAGYPDLAVISAVGTRGYYEKLGFSSGELYQHRSLATPSSG